MISLTSIAAAAAAIAIGGTGSAALLMNAPPTKADVAVNMTAAASADLSGAEQAQQDAIAALRSGTAEGKAEAAAQIKLATERLEKASDEMKTAVNTGSKTAIDALNEFTTKSVRLINSLAVTASSTANASVKTGSDLLKAVETQITTARGVATANGTAAVQVLSQAKADLPRTISGALGSVPQAPAGVQVSVSGQSSSSVNGLPAGVTSSTGGQVGLAVGR